MHISWIFLISVGADTHIGPYIFYFIFQLVSFFPALSVA